MNRYIFLLLVVNYLSFSYSTCIKDRKYSIFIDNNSPHPIRYYFDGLSGFHYYPDTILPVTMPPMVRVESGKRFYQSGSISWEEFFKKLPFDTLSLYIFHPDTLNAYNWPIIRSQYKVLKRYDLSIQDLQQMNYTIKYQ